MDKKFTIGSTVIYAPSQNSVRRAQYVGKEAIVTRHPPADPSEVYIAFSSGIVLLVPEYDLRPAMRDFIPAQPSIPTRTRAVT